jgi:hypothetical protein
MPILTRSVSEGAPCEGENTMGRGEEYTRSQGPPSLGRRAAIFLQRTLLVVSSRRSVMTTILVAGTTILLGCMPHNRTGTIPTSSPTPTLTLPPAPLTNVKELLDKAIAARGGEAALKKLYHLHTRGKGKSTPGNVVSGMNFRSTVSLPDRIRDEWDYENGTKFIQVLDREKGFVSINATVKEMDKGNMKSVKESLHVNEILSLVCLKDPKYTLEPLPEQRREGVMTLGFNVKCKDQPDVMMCFDKETNLPLMVRNKVTDSNLFIEREQDIFFSHYEAVEGLQFPKRWVIYNDGNLSMELNFETLKFLEKAEDVLFAKP